jgi:hypothetical protein
MPTYNFVHHQLDVSDLGGPLFGPVLEVWGDLRQGAFAPLWAAGDLVKYPAAAIPFFTVVQAVETPQAFKYLFWGTGHVDVKGVDYTGRSPIDHEPAEHGRAIDKEFRMVVEQRRMLAFVHDLRPQTTRSSLFQECLRLPLSADGEHVTHVISYSDWQTENEKWKRFFKAE